MSRYAVARILTLHGSLERIGPVFDREDSALFDHHLMKRERRARRLGGPHIARNFRPVERSSGPDADSRGSKSSYCTQNDDLAHGVTLCGSERRDCFRISPATPSVRRFTQADFFVAQLKWCSTSRRTDPQEHSRLVSVALRLS